MRSRLVSMQVGCSGRKDSCLRFDEAAQQWSHAHRRTFLIFGYVDGFGWCEIEISTHSLIGWAVFLPKVFWTYLSHELRSDVHQALAIHVEIIHYADSTVWSGPGKSQGHPVIAKTALAEAYCECLNRWSKLKSMPWLHETHAPSMCTGMRSSAHRSNI